ncbi:hypothetical protein ASPWEDRAFT_68470, partial [Aspergillus wentii DTO 134E9]
MSDKVFFPDYIDKEITFSNENGSTTWILTEKLSEQNDQLDEFEFREFEDVSAAYGVFRCKNASNPRDTATMKIFMQVPYAGSEFTSRQKRADQASDRLTYQAEKETDALRQLTERNCQHAPRVLGYQQDKQDEEGLVPNGFIVYLVMALVPGVQLERSLYRQMPLSERQKICRAFKVAWLDCVMDGGIFTYRHGICSVSWDSTEEKIYITNFESCRQRAPTDRWQDIIFLQWGLMQPPRGYVWYEETEEHPDMSLWRIE